jgi:RNA polymerase sigma-70 factor, ECF subfamily
VFRQHARAPDRALSPLPDDAAREDERLLLAASDGDLDAFNKLVERHERAVFNLCYRMLGDADAADDAAQDTFLKAWSASKTFRGGLAKPWLMRIATNRCLDILRSQKRHPTSSLDSHAELVEQYPLNTRPAEPPDAFAVRVDVSAHLERALQGVPDDQRLAIVLCDIQGMSHEEAASIMGVATGTVKSRLSRARARLRDILHSDPVTRELLQQTGRFQSE